MRLVTKRAIKWGIPSLVILLIVIYGFISFFIASGITKYERRSQEDSPAAHALQFEDVEFMSRGDNITLNGWYIFGEGEGPTLVFVHGIGSIRSGDYAVSLASLLAERGFNILMFDLRGHGSSGGDFISAGYFEQQDVLGAIDFLVGQGVSSERIGVIGFSMGASTAIMAVLDEPAIQALIADSPYSNASDLFTREIAHRTVFPEWMAPIFIPTIKLMAKAFYSIDIGALVPEEAVKILPYPIMVIHGTSDTRIPFDHGVRVYEAAHSESILWLVPGVDHVDAFLTYPEEYVERVVDYFSRQLGIDYKTSATIK